MTEPSSASDVYAVKMPVLAVGMEEGIVIEWFVQVGDVVVRDQPICLVETEKVTIPVESPVAGRVRELLVGTGATAAVGEPLAVLDR